MKINEELHEIRDQLGLTQAEMAEALGYTWGNGDASDKMRLHRMEKGITHIPPIIIEKARSLTKQQGHCESCRWFKAHSSISDFGDGLCMFDPPNSEGRPYTRRDYYCSKWEENI